MRIVWAVDCVTAPRLPCVVLGNLSPQTHTSSTTLYGGPAAWSHWPKAATRHGSGHGGHDDPGPYAAVQGMMTSALGCHPGSRVKTGRWSATAPYINRAVAVEPVVVALALQQQICSRKHGCARSSSVRVLSFELYGPVL